jgi:putative heme transporter
MGKSRAVRIAGLVLVVAVAGLTLHNRLPDPAEVVAATRTVNPWFLVLAVLAEVASLRHFALQQRRLLAGFGVGMSIPRALAVTVSRSAIAASVPAGSAVSAGYAFRQFRTAGASRRAAGSVTVLSGLLSGVALVLLFGVVLLIPETAAAGEGGILAYVLGSLVVAFAVFAVDWRLARRVYVPVEAVSADDLPTDGVLARLVGTAGRSITNLRQVPPQAWMLSLVHAAVNWATDLACLAAVAAAFDLKVSLTSLATVYLTVQLLRQVPISPGGIGVIEVALLAGLISAGSPDGVAAAAVLVYRLLSCWIIIPIGALAYTVLNRRTAPVEDPVPVPVVVLGGSLVEALRPVPVA